MSLAVIATVALGPTLLVQSQTARPALDYASTSTIRDTCVKWARERGMNVALVVLDARAMPMTLAHMDGVSMAGGEIAQWKANAAAKFGRATADFAATPPPPGVPNVAAMQGGVPIYTAAGVLLGGVGVSGGKPADDAACAVAGIEAAGLTPARPVKPLQ